MSNVSAFKTIRDAQVVALETRVNDLETRLAAITAALDDSMPKVVHQINVLTVFMEQSRQVLGWCLQRLGYEGASRTEGGLILPPGVAMPAATEPEKPSELVLTD